jgi:diguanylate cyclase (GGDEF)-like protein
MSISSGGHSLRATLSAADASRNPIRAEANARPRLLVVDDISDNRSILKRRFESRGFDVTEAESGFAAIELIENDAFDLVLLDVMMPGIDGIETLKRIRSQRSASALPVIMVTAKSESGNIVEALEQGANDYVTKPVDFAVALARVNTQISRRRAEQQVVSANEELRKANEDLEGRVEERTRRLIDANQRLKKEISDREELQARSQYLAYHDSMTGLGNRLLFKEQLEEALEDVTLTPHPLAVLFLDLDGFKAVNDDLGHAAGDETLRAMADILLKQSRGINVICRYGGDEFAVLLVETSKSGARLYADRIRYVLSTWTFAHGRRVTASFGIASLPEDVAPAADELIRAADEALYAAKRAGKNRVSVHEDIGAAPGVRPGA